MEGGGGVPGCQCVAAHPLDNQHFSKLLNPCPPRYSDVTLHPSVVLCRSCRRRLRCRASGGDGDGRPVSEVEKAQEMNQRHPMDALMHK